MTSKRSIIRHTDGDRELVIDTRHLPLVVTTWFAAPSVELVEFYDRWLRRFVETSSLSGRRVVLLDDATRAERPNPQVRGRMAKLECPPAVVVARVIVAPTAALRGAVTALTWSTGKQLPTVDTIETGVNECLQIFSDNQIVPPRKFEIEPAQPSNPSR
ncbi:MAG TPA: hypothetical protein VK034_17055 [Enhygromyxa sp.]|nr:hypothetical protein [Enhygromyxa sp.]